MWRTFWYMIKLAIVILGALWLLSLEGEVVLEWHIYKITAHVGFVMLTIAAFVLAITWLTRSALFVERLPKIYKIYRKERMQEKGHTAILRSLTALSAGDGSIAAYQAQRAQKLSPAQDGLAQLLSAHAARLNGKTDDAEKGFEALASKKETAMLGYQGLIKTAYEQGQEQKALTLAYDAYDKSKKNKDFLPKIYDMEIDARNWTSALKTLRRIEKTGALPKEKIKHDRAAILTQTGLEAERGGLYGQASEQYKAALKVSNGFLPAALSLCAIYSKHKQESKLRKTIEAQWKIQPHPELVPYWMELLSERKLKKPSVRYEWVKRLASHNINHIESQLAIAKIAIEDGLWNEAQKRLLDAELEEPRAAIYRMLEEIAHCSDHDDNEARKWADKGIDAPGDPVWMCEETGRIYPKWQIIAEPSGGFNTIKWRTPRRLQIAGISSPYGSENMLSLSNFMD